MTLPDSSRADSSRARTPRPAPASSALVGQPPSVPLDYACVEIVGEPFIAIWSPEDGAVRAAGFAAGTTGAAGSAGAAAESVTAAQVLADPLWARLAASDPNAAARGLAEHPNHTHLIAAALRDYERGELAALDRLAVTQRETPFKAEVWRALREVVGGEAVTYTELAARAGRPRAVRAAASGCATNLVALIVPCHRIVRSDGGLGGYLFGTEVKERLLVHERAHSTI